MKRTSVAAVAVLALVSTAAAAEMPRYSLSPFVGGYSFDRKENLKDAPVVGLRLGHDYTRKFGVEALLDFVPTKFKGGGSVRAWEYGVEALYRPHPDWVLIPELAAGVRGVTYGGAASGSKLAPAYGIGLRYPVDKDLALRADLRHIIPLDRTMNNLEYTFGVAWYFGGAKEEARKPAVAAVTPPPADSDRDGVPDAADRCPGTPEGGKVDANGCPIDSDRDGVPDYQDRCPGTPEGVKVDGSGCPVDSDGDGVPDHRDKCPGTPPGVTVDGSGCPVDADRDGIPDYQDKCPGTPEGVKVDAAGCPLDSDRDGVPDSRDKCPGTPEGMKVDAAGCPLDSDGDGVADHLDKCPGTLPKAKVDSLGCQIEKPKINLKMEFDTNRTDIREEYRDEIAAVADYLKKYPGTKVLLEGHTDSTGSEEKNRVLSQQRAENVKKYLVEKSGVAADRIEAKGFGSSKPVATNDTAEGRQENRRIDAVFSEK